MKPVYIVSKKKDAPEQIGPWDSGAIAIIGEDNDN